MSNPLSRVEQAIRERVREPWVKKIRETESLVLSRIPRAELECAFDPSSSNFSPISLIDYLRAIFNQLCDSESQQEKDAIESFVDLVLKSVKEQSPPPSPKRRPGRAKK